MTASRDNDAMSKGRAQTPGAQYEANKKPQAHNNKAYSLFPGAAESYMEAVKDYEINARDAATAAFSEKDAKIKADDKNSFTWPKSTRGPPPGIDTTIPPSKKNWNLAGHDANDRSKNVITEADWYDFMPKQLAKVEQLQKARGTNADAIVREGGGNEEVTANEGMK